LLPSPYAYAHRDDYLDETLVYLTLEDSEFEGEYWFDYGTHQNQRDDFLRHNVALEWGITDHLMTDARVTYRKDGGRSTKLDSGRIETRYRLKDEGDLPVDIAISAEINWQNKDNASSVTAIEPRIILSKDMANNSNITLNLSEEIPANSDPSAFVIAFGFRNNWNQLIRLGSEFQYDTQDNAGSIIPQVWFALPDELTIKIGYSAGIDQNQEDFGRIAFEMEF